MEISVIASGSNGNCYLIENKDTSLLVEAGKSCREIEQRMKKLGKSPENVKGILISHCHTDHMRGADVLSRKHNIPVYLTEEVYNECGVLNGEIRHFALEDNFKIGNLRIRPVPTSHDVNSCGFMINDFGIFTDTGIVTQQMRDVVPKLKGLILESNYDMDLLLQGPYPAYLKYRILGEQGHLSNIHASELIAQKGRELQLCLLGHLSAVNNTVELTKQTFETIVKRKVDYAVLSRDRESGSWTI